MERDQNEIDFRNGCMTEVIRFRLPEGNTTDFDRDLLEDCILKFTASVSPSLSTQRFSFCAKLLLPLLTILISTMQDETHGDFDEYDPVRPTRPLWVDAQIDPLGDDTPRNQQLDCIIILQWEDLGDRELWLKSFMSYDYTTLGHKAHVLGQICPEIEAWPAVLSSVRWSDTDGEEDAEEEDDNMGL